MRTNSLKIAALIAAGALLGASPALALDGKVVLDQLVKKGVLTPEEADAIIQKDTEKKLSLNDPANAHAKINEVKNLTIYGKFHSQYKFMTSNDRVGNRTNVENEGVEIRRLDLGAAANIGDSWYVDICYRAESNTPGATAFQIDKAILTYDTHDFGLFTAGIKKAPFGYEEYTSSGALNTTERGIMNNYLVGNGNSNSTTVTPTGENMVLAERRIGLYYDTAETSKIEKKGGTKFGAAATGDNRRGMDQKSNDYAFYLNAMHVHKFDDGVFLDFGVNTMYSDTDTNNLAGAPTTGIDTLGVEVYSRLRYGKFTFIADAIQAMKENGKLRSAGDYRTAMPFGVALTGMYMLTDSVQPVVSLNYVDTDGRGIRPAGVIRNGENFGGAADHAINLFVGSHWYITPKSLKLTAGLEYGRFEGAVGGSTTPVKTDVYGGRVQIQALF